MPAKYGDPGPLYTWHIGRNSGCARPSVGAPTTPTPSSVKCRSTPLASRNARWITHPFALWDDPADTSANVDWARSFRRDIAAFATDGVYLNFIGNEGQDRIRAAFGPANYARLAAVKAEYDPANVFRGNQNIAPEAAGRPA